MTRWLVSHLPQLLLAVPIVGGLLAVILSTSNLTNGPAGVASAASRLRRDLKREDFASAKLNLEEAYQLVVSGQDFGITGLTELAAAAGLTGQAGIAYDLAMRGLDAVNKKSRPRARPALRLHYTAGAACLELGEYVSAESHFSAGLAIANARTSAKYQQHKIELGEAVGIAKVKMGNYAGAIEVFRQLLDGNVVPRDTENSAKILGHIATAKFLSGDWEGAEVTQIEGNHQRRTRDKPDESFLAGLIQLAAFRIAIGKTDLAAANVAEAKRADIESLPRHWKGVFSQVDGMLAQSVGDCKAAAEHYAAAIRVYSEGGFEAIEKHAEASAGYALSMHKCGDDSHLVDAVQAARMLPEPALARRARLATSLSAEATRRGLCRQATEMLAAFALDDLALNGRLTETALDAYDLNRPAIANADPAEAAWLDSMFQWAGNWRE